jgi:peptide/nickel transport system substrate-binding protein
MSSKFFLRLAVLLTASSALLTSCTKSDVASSSVKGGTLYIFTSASQINHLDPQRNYAPEDLAFASGYLNRTLTQYPVSDDDNKSSNLVGDLATDTGSVSDGGKTWSFTIRDGVKWQDGTAVTCEDIKYGVSRTFAADTIYDGYLYALSLLDIPKNVDGTSKYAGPYRKDSAGQSLFDKAVQCVGNRITFKLSVPATDFNYTVTLSAFAPVQRSKDTRSAYDQNVQSNGPYMIAPSKSKRKMILIRNPYWDAVTDSIRKANPDRIEYSFSVPKRVITQRLMNSTGKFANAISPDSISTNKIDQVFSGAQFSQRRFNELNPYFSFFAINTKKVPNLKHRQAILAGINRDALRTLAGGPYVVDYADGFLKPNIGQDYAQTGLWDGILGDKIPPTGNVDLAKRLIKESGAKFPNPLVFDYSKNPTNDKVAASIMASLARVGIRVKPHGVETNAYLNFLLNPARQGGMSAASWNTDWQNASSVIPDLLTPTGGFALSQYSNASWVAKVADARAMTDRGEQAKAWQSLNKEAVRLALACPNQFGLEQRLAGSKVQGAFIWAPYSSWPYATLSVTK